MKDPISNDSGGVESRHAVEGCSETPEKTEGIAHAKKPLAPTNAPIEPCKLPDSSANGNQRRDEEHAAGRAEDSRGSVRPAVTSTPDENRRKILSLSEYDVLGLLRDMDHLPGFVRLPRFDLPEGVKVCGVYPRHDSRTFEFVLEHQSFDPVSAGALLPHIAVGHVSVPLAVKEGGAL